MIRILLSTRLGERKWTQADLVRETGIRASTINDLYHEMTDRVSLEQLDQICKALDCDINEILVREEKICVVEICSWPSIMETSSIGIPCRRACVAQVRRKR